MTTAGEVIQSPVSWGILTVCITGGWFAKKGLFEGVLTGLIAPVFLGFIWCVAYLALALPYAVLSILWPGMITKLGSAYAAFPDDTAFLLHPATLITGLVFILYCRMEGQLNRRSVSLAPRREQLGEQVFPREGSCPRAAKRAFIAARWRRARERGLRVLDRAKSRAKFRPRSCPTGTSRFSSSPAAPGVSRPSHG